MTQKTSDILHLIRACVSGDREAQYMFQEEYGEDIYNFPVKIYRLLLEEAGDFYVYVFEKDRIFTRIRTFTGRNDIQFRTFLSYYVLKDLFLEWRRTRREIETISLNTPLGDPTESDRVLEDILPDTVEIEEVGSKSKSLAAEVWSFLDPEKRLCLKLLYLIECDLGSEDIRLLASLSGRSIRDTLILVAEVQEGLRRKDERLSRPRDELDSVWGWILLRQRELQEIDKKILLMTAEGNSSGKDDLVTQKEKLEKNITKRHRQRERIEVICPEIHTTFQLELRS